MNIIILINYNLIYINQLIEVRQNNHNGGVSMPLIKLSQEQRLLVFNRRRAMI